MAGPLTSPMPVTGHCFCSYAELLNCRPALPASEAATQTMRHRRPAWWRFTCHQQLKHSVIRGRAVPFEDRMVIRGGYVDLA